MHNIVLLVNTLTEHTYNLYMRLYSSGLVSNPIIYTNKCSVATHMNIPVFYTKYIFNQHYHIVLTDNEIEYPKNVYDKLIIIDNNDTIDIIINKIEESISC